MHRTLALSSKGRPTLVIYYNRHNFSRCAIKRSTNADNKINGGTDIRRANEHHPARRIFQDGAYRLTSHLDLRAYYDICALLENPYLWVVSCVEIQ